LAEPTDLAQFCRRILLGGTLRDKLAAPPPHGLDLPPARTAIAVDIAIPARAPGLELRTGAGPLPRPGELVDAECRARCLARFAHHELMAVELFAWALLRWPELGDALQRELLRVLADEQRHCRLYLARLAAHGASLEDFALSDYFWKQLPAIRSAPRPQAAFAAAMGLTLEQANLDFTLVYRDAFRTAGDEQSAIVCQRVHDDEIGHVRMAIRWLRQLLPPPEFTDDAARYEASVPFPLGAARAKGRRFDSRARQRAGLDASLIECVRTAQSTQRPRAGRAAGTDTPDKNSRRTNSVCTNSADTNSAQTDSARKSTARRRPPGQPTP
jgi:uncharacterized ferritin-like protein (DUF455 family)